MFRSRCPCPRRRRLVVSALVFCFILLLRHSGRGVLAQANDDGDDGDDDGNTLLPTGAPASSEDSTSSKYPDCPGYTSHIRDGYCDSDLNVASCGWDGGDCCLCTCGQGLDSADELPHTCGQAGDGYDCQDPDVPADCGATPSPAASLGYPDCEGYMYNLQNSYCNDDLNNAECGWDGGDCCRCTCRDYGYNNCGDFYGFDCRDPEAPTDCASPSPTPSPTADNGDPKCVETWIGEGICHDVNNKEECGWDGGDCCLCECVGDQCGLYSAFDCQDPNASTDCETPSPTTPIVVDNDDIGYGCDWARDGQCDPDHNNEYCGFDGGDCCYCDCEGTSCGSLGYNCVDPSSICYGTSSNYEGNEGYSPGHNEGARASVGAENGEVARSSSEGISLSNSILIVIAVVVICSFAGLCLHRPRLSRCCKKERTTAAGTSSQRPPSAPAPPSPAAAAPAAAPVPVPVPVPVRAPVPAPARARYPPEGYRARPLPETVSYSVPQTAPAGDRARPLREAVFYPVPEDPSSAAIAAEAVGDWRLATALRASASIAPTNDVQQRDHAAGTQESKQANEVGLGRAFYRSRQVPLSPAAAAEAAGDSALAAALRISAAAAATDDVEGRAHVDEQSAGRFEAGIVVAQESRQADEAEHGRVGYDTGRAGRCEVGSTERGDGGEAVEGKENDAESVWEEVDASTPVVAGAVSGVGDAADEKIDKEHGIKGGAAAKNGKDSSAPDVAGAVSGVGDAAEEKIDEEHAIAGGAAAKNGTDTSAPEVAGAVSGVGDAAEEKIDEDNVESVAGARDGIGEGGEGGRVNGKADGKAVTEDVAVVQEICAVKNQAGDKEVAYTCAVEEDGVGEDDAAEAVEKETDDVCPVQEGFREKQMEQNTCSAVEGEALVTEVTTVGNPEAGGASADEKGSADPPDAE